ncbi:MAG TPA: glycosyltransferase family 1 protein [Bryobacterales bacterium]|nr:glycosyltransferase family 1 protein [Bryobacterales bacterium]
MRVLYDATPLLLRSAGVKNYHHALLVRLLPRMRPHTIRLFPFLSSLGRNRNERSNYPRAATVARLGTLLAANYLHLPLGSWAARQADLFHVTNHLLHPPGRIKLTSFIHDPTPVLMPEFHTASNVRYFRHFLRHVAPRLAGILVPSEAVKRDLAGKLGIKEEKITVVPHGVDEDFFPGSPLEPMRQVYDLPEQYILFLGSLEPRKNLRTLLEAYRLLPEDLRRAHPLIVAGASGWKNRDLRRELQSQAAAGVRAIGYVAPELLPLVYARASVFVFPSLYEGFGMPLLEAMAAGAPVVTSNVSAMPEVVADAGLTVDPRSAAELARAIERVLADATLRAALAEKGRARARQFTWEKTALATRAFFERVAGA